MNFARGKYNVLMMRDNSTVHRYRISSTWLKVFLYGFCFLVLLAAGGGLAGFTFWRQNAALRSERAALQHDLRQAGIELERLQNVDKILKSNDPEELQSLLGSMGSVKQKPAPAPAQPPDLKRLFNDVDTRQVGVDNLQARMDDEAMNVSFNLSNLLAQGTLAGEASLALVTSEGALLPVEASQSELSFQIQRFKRMDVKFSLPGDTAREKLFGLRLVIRNPSGQTIFSATHTLSEIIS